MCYFSFIIANADADVDVYLVHMLIILLLFQEKLYHSIASFANVVLTIQMLKKCT